MPVTLSTNLKNHMAQPVTTMAPCLLIRRTDGVIIAATLHDKPQTITMAAGYVSLGAPSGSITYEPAHGYEPSAIENTSDLSVPNQEIMGGWDIDAITEEDLRNGKYDGAEYWMFEVNWANLGHGIFPRSSGEIGETTPMDYQWKMELRGLMQRYTQIIGSVVSPECPYNVGSNNGTARDCRVDMTPFTETATVVSVNPDGSFVVSGLSSSEANWYSLGVMTGVSSPPTVLAGLAQEIKSFDFATGTLTPWLPFPATPDIGDTFTVTAGCDKRRETCKLKFNNLVNFGGFPDIPGQDVVSAYYVPPAASQTQS
jgi:uncharacterized phage protein (TIGR02218 family)